jgi:hypothetical protein
MRADTLPDDHHKRGSAKAGSAAGQASRQYHRRTGTRDARYSIKERPASPAIWVEPRSTSSVPVWMGVFLLLKAMIRRFVCK